MSRVAIVGLLCSALAAADSLVLTTLLDSAGPEEYNRALLGIRAECPDLAPVLVQIDKELRMEATGIGPEPDWAVRYNVSFWNDSGGLLARREFWGPDKPGDGFAVRVTDDRSRLLAYHVGIGSVAQTWYGSNGETLVTVSESQPLLDIGGRYLRLYFDEDGGGPYSDHSVLCGALGDSIARIPGCWVRWSTPGSVARDTSVALQADSWILVYGPRGNERFRQSCVRTASLSLARDARRLAYATIRSVTGCNIVTGRSWTVRFKDALVLDSLESVGSRTSPPGYFAQPEVAIRTDGRVAVCRRFNQGVGGALQVRVFDSTGTELMAPVETQLQWLQSVGWSGDYVVAMGDSGIVVVGLTGYVQRFEMANRQTDRIRVSGPYIAVPGERRHRLFRLDRRQQGE